MAIINVDDAYILNETGAQVDKTTGIPFKNESLTEAEAAQARANIRAGGSNPNLLDNAYFVGGGSQLGDGVFPINQRGQASYSGNGNIFDRWTLQNAFATLAADAVYFGSTTQNVWGLMQQVPSCFRNLWGETVTVSAIINDELVQETYTLPSSGAFDMPAAGLGGVFINLYSYDGSNIVFRIYTQYTAQYHIKAAKLEFGTVSTLPNDPPPDFGDELRKCKAYFQRVKQPQGYTAPIGFGIMGASSNILRTLIPLSSPLRDATSITASATNIGQMKVCGNGSYFTPSAITGRTVLNGHAVVDITVSGSLQNYMVYHIILEDASAYIDLSAEL